MKLIISSILAFFIVCRLSGQDARSSIQIVDLAGPLANKKDIPLSRYVDKTVFVQLESKPEVMISAVASFEVCDDFIIVRSVGLGQVGQILLFDRNTGKFLREIGKKGRGPGEYDRTGFLPFNSELKEIYAIGSADEIMVYNSMGNFLYKIKIPAWTDPLAPNDFSSRISVDPKELLDKTTFAGHVNNFSGWEKRKVVLFNKNEVIKIFPNYLTFTRGELNFFSSPPGGFSKFYRWNKKLNFIETFCDTLFEVTKAKLIPRYFFDMGKYRAEYSEQGDILYNKELYKKGQWTRYGYLSDIDENRNYLFIQIFLEGKWYTGVIDKKTSTVNYCKSNNSVVSGFKDDVTGLMDVVPYSITSNNEMVWIIQPGELVKWIKANPEKAASAGKILPWLKNIDDLDNPIIAIGKCKE